MGKLLISAGTSGITSDEVTASKADVLAGKTALTSDSNDEALAGTLPNKTGTVQEGAAALDGTNARLTLTIPATGKYTGTSKLFATYARIASLIGLTAAKIMKGNTILNIAGTATSDATAGDTDILSGKTAYVNGSKKTGTMANVPNTSSVTLTASDGRKVIKQDASSNALWVTGNSDNVRRALIQVPTTGYYTNSTIIGVPEDRMASAGGVTAAKLLKGQSAFNIAGTATSDATAAASNILKGKTAYINGSKTTGTMKNITSDTTIKFAASNTTPVVAADERYIDNNTDGVRRMCLRYMGENGYITGNTLFGLPAQTKTVNPSESAQNIGPDAGKLLEKVTVNAISKTHVGSGITRQGAKTITAGTGNVSAGVNGKYMTGEITVAPTPTEAKTVNPSASNQTIKPSSGKYLSQVIVNGFGNNVYKMTEVVKTNVKFSYTNGYHIIAQDLPRGSYLSDSLFHIFIKYNTITSIQKYDGITCHFEYANGVFGVTISGNRDGRPGASTDKQIIYIFQAIT